MELLVRELTQVKKYQFIEDELFNINMFSPHTALFPKQVFNKKFDNYLFLNNTNWFSDKKSFKSLINFIEKSNDNFFYCSVPRFRLLNAIKIPVTTSLKEYISAQTFKFEKGEYKDIGLRVSAEMFFFGKTKEWAMVYDLVHCCVIIGITKKLSPILKESFGEDLLDDIKSFIKKMEEFHGVKLDNRKKIIKRYS